MTDDGSPLCPYSAAFTNFDKISELLLPSQRKVGWSSSRSQKTPLRRSILDRGLIGLRLHGSSLLAWIVFAAWILFACMDPLRFGSTLLLALPRS